MYLCCNIITSLVVYFNSPTKKSENLAKYTPIYNPSDDFFYIDGKKWKRAFLNNLIIYENGSFADGFSLGQNLPLLSKYSNDGSFSNGENGIYGIMPSSTYHSRGNAINGKIDFSPYAKLYASCIQNGITYTLYKDISSVETEGYINISLHYSNECYVDLYPSTLIGPNYLAESKITDLASISGLSSGLNVYYTKIWLEK